MNEMILQQHFDKFHQNISLDESRAARINSARSNFARFISEDRPLSNLMVGQIFTQGSWEQNTVVRPAKEGIDYDVDVVVPINARQHTSTDPDDILQYFVNRLNTYDAYKGRVRKRYRCVRLEYSGGFHFDIVPAHVTNDTARPFQIPDREHNTWHYTNPQGLTEFFAYTNRACHGRFTRVVKMFKRWRDFKFDYSRAPASLLLQTLIAYWEPYKTADGTPPIRIRTRESNSDAALFTDISCIMQYKLQRMNSVPIIPNPSYKEENFARDWTQPDYDLFKKRLDFVVDRATRAYDETDTARAVAFWQEIFGTSFQHVR